VAASFAVPPLKGPMIEFQLNDVEVALDLPPETPLLPLLRNDLGLNGPKYGCGLGQCGACTILIDDRPARACLLFASHVQGRSVTTLEGLARNGCPDEVQQAFIDEQGTQCGYCLNGMIMTVRALINGPRPVTEERIKRALDHVLCRCGAHIEILASALRAAEVTNRLAPRDPSDDN
jgi:nicotinate dehydrogenase subunit A